MKNDNLDKIVSACQEGRTEDAATIWKSSFHQAEALNPAYKTLIQRLTAQEFQALLDTSSNSLVDAESTSLFAQHEFQQCRQLLRHFCDGRADKFVRLYGRNVFCSFMLKGLDGLRHERELIVKEYGVKTWHATSLQLPPNILDTQDVIGLVNSLQEPSKSKQLEGYLTRCLFMADEDFDRVLQSLDFSVLGLSGSTAVQLARSRIKDYAILRADLRPEPMRETLWQTRLEFENAAKAIGAMHCETETHQHLKPVFRQLADLEDAASGSFMHSASCCWDAMRVVDILRERIAQGTPTSLIRLGDGEGRFLPYPADIADFRSSDRAETESIWWGKYAYSETGAIEAENLLQSAVRNADLIGIPPFHRCVHSMGTPHGKNSPNGRGLRAILEWLANDIAHEPSAPSGLSGILRRMKPQPERVKPYLVSSHIHTDILYWDLLGDMLTDVKELVLVSCHDLTDLFKNMFGIDVVHVHLPAEHKYRNVFCDTSEHEDPTTTFGRMREEILQIGCNVNLIAAGFIGKLLCHEVKRAGGIAIDIGSTADYLAGHPTRIIPMHRFEK